VTKARYMSKTGLRTLTQVTVIKLHKVVISGFGRHENNIKTFSIRNLQFLPYLKFGASVLSAVAVRVIFNFWPNILARSWQHCSSRVREY
jgi:hypothetical protein